ncbi:MAG TPA: hypothetical protein VGI64_04125 [Streptosporangiaceae bacterium]|jgi:hypothetical protein
MRNAQLTAGLWPAAGLVLGSLLLGACSSPSHRAAPAVSPRQAACRQVSGALADGPDPAGPGQAEAQMLPLRQIHAPDQALASAISALDRAYRELFASSGKSSSAKEAVAVASKKIDALCPGAAA